MKIRTYYRLIPAVLISIFLFLGLTGCVTAGKHALPKGGDMTMADIYKQETGLSMNANQDNSNELTEARSITGQSVRFNYQGYTTKVAAQVKEIKSLFKPLPNPEIPIYVFPHLVQLNGESQPVPGYTTVFFLYQKNHFAMAEDGGQMTEE